MFHGSMGYAPQTSPNDSVNKSVVSKRMSGCLSGFSAGVLVFLMFFSSAKDSVNDGQSWFFPQSLSFCLFPILRMWSFWVGTRTSQVTFRWAWAPYQDQATRPTHGRHVVSIISADQRRLPEPLDVSTVFMGTEVTCRLSWKMPALVVFINGLV